LLVPWPIPSIFSITWKPVTIFPDPVLFRSSPLSISFSIYLCIVWILSEVSCWFASRPPVASRLFTFLFLGAGFISFFASNALALLLAWVVLDVLAFFFLLYSEFSVADSNLSPALSNSFGLFSINILSNFLILYPAIAGPQSMQLDWSSVWTNPPTEIGLRCFLVGVFLRLFIVPLLVSSSRLKTAYPTVEVFLRLLYPATMLAFLSHAWPGLYILSMPEPLPTIIFWFLILMLFSSGWRSLFSFSSLSIRDAYPTGIAALAILASLQTPQSSLVFQGAVSLLMLGGSVLWLFPSTARSTLFDFVVFVPLLLSISGFVYSPGEPLLSSLLSMQIGQFWYFLTLVVAGVIFLISAIIRLTLTSTTSDTPLHVVAHVTITLFTLAASAFFFYPGFRGAEEISFGDIGIPILALASGIILFVFFRHTFRIRSLKVFFLDLQTPYSWIAHVVSIFTIRLRNLFLGIESALNGEGAFLWAFSILLLAWIAFQS